MRARRNIIVSGATGSGKTTLTKALLLEIPSDDRLITLEDASELRLAGHPNTVRLFYSKDDQGLARVTPKKLLEACLRMRPDRILLAELRSDEAYYYLRNVNSGSTPFPRTVELRLKTSDLAAPLYDACAGYGIARGSRTGPPAPRRAFDTGDGSRVPA